MTATPGSPDASAEVVGLDYWTAEQFAKMLQVSPKSVFRWAATDPSLPCLRIGRTLRFPRARILAWLRAKEQGPGRPRRLRQPSPSDGQVRVAASPGQDGHSS